MIYFDHNATTKISAAVLKKMNEAHEFPLNSSSTHQLGRKASAMIEEARSEVKNFLNAQNYEVIFTSSGTEATNNVFFGSDVEAILIGKTEHSSVYSCRPEGKKIIEIDVLKDGLIDFSDLKKQIENIGTKNFLVSVMLVNNETGAIQPIAEIAKIVHQNGGLIHSDIVQAAGKIELDLEKLNIDFASISAHKIHGPQGVGALLIRKGLEIKPLIFGGKQENSKRAGTSNVAGIIGFGAACRIAKDNISNFSKTAILRDFLESEIEKIAKEDVKIFSKEAPRIPNTTMLATKNIDYQTQLIHFDLNGFCVSAGAACSSGTLQESRILKAMNGDPIFLKNAIRISIGDDATKEEVENFIKIWNDLYTKTK